MTKVTKSQEAREALYNQVTDSLVTLMENEPGTWSKSWAETGRPLNAKTGNGYKGLNRLILAMVAAAHFDGCNVWGTYKQFAAMGAQVRQGQKAAARIRVPIVVKRDDSDDSQFVAFKVAAVFNAQQVDGFTMPDLEPIGSTNERVAIAEAFTLATGANITHGGADAFYMHKSGPGGDFINMPEFDSFRDAESYYATLLHELTHWTGAAERLDRVKGVRFGDPLYAFEELVAELGAAFLCADLGISVEPRVDHAQYLTSWIAKLKEDNQAIVRAAGLAEKAADFLHDCQPKTNTESKAAA